MSTIRIVTPHTSLLRISSSRGSAWRSSDFDTDSSGLPCRFAPRNDEAIFTSTVINGPARLTKYLKIDKRFNGKSASRRTGLWFEDRGIKVKKSRIIAGKRVGVDYAGVWAKKLYNFRIENE